MSEVIQLAPVAERAQLHMVVLTGGGGAETLGPALSQAVENVTFVTSTADDGGSSGHYRRARGILPVGDLRQAIVALSEQPDRQEFNKRDADGHAHGNTRIVELIAANHGDSLAAIRAFGDELELRKGLEVLPVTEEPTTLVLDWPDGQGESVIGEDNISRYDLHGRRPNIRLRPGLAELHPLVTRAIAKADIVLIAPSNFYCSTAAILAAPGMAEALRTSRAQKHYLANILTRPGHTDGMTAVDHARALTSFMGGALLDSVYANTTIPAPEQAAEYLHDGETFVEPGTAHGERFNFVTTPLLDSAPYIPQAGDHLAGVRSLARHWAKACVEQVLAQHVQLQMNSPITVANYTA